MSADATLAAFEPAAQVAVARFLNKRTRNYALVRDELLQAARIAVWRATQRHDPSRASLSALLDKRICGAVIDEFRRMTGHQRKHRLRCISLHAGASRETIADGIADQRDDFATVDTWDEIESRLAVLTPRQRTDLLLHAAGVTMGELAVIYGVTARTIYTRMAAAREKLTRLGLVIE